MLNPPHSFSSSENEEDDCSSGSETIEEPLLKYSRISNDVPSTLKSYKATCLTVHSKFFMLGTSFGSVFMFDLEGNISGKDHVFPSSSFAIEDISIDEDANFFIMCSGDRVYIQGLASKDVYKQLNFDYSIKAIAIEPSFSSSNSRTFITGGEKIILHERGIFSTNKVTELPRPRNNKGAIRLILWKGPFLAYASDNVASIYDLTQRELIVAIKREEIHSSADNYLCNLCWQDNDTLLLGWVKTVSIYKIRERHVKPDDARSLQTKYVERVHNFKMEDFVTGVAPFYQGSNNCVTVLSYIDPLSDDGILHSSIESSEDDDADDLKPFLQIIEPVSTNTSELLYEQNLKVKDYAFCIPSDYKLVRSELDNTYYICCPFDIIVAKPRTLEDQIEWHQSNGFYEDALEIARKNTNMLQPQRLQEIGLDYLDYLFEKHRYEKVARNCCEILGHSKECWEDIIYKFEAAKQLNVISSLVPTSNPQLSPIIYEIILNWFLDNDHDKFLQLIKSWPSSIYQISVITTSVENKYTKGTYKSILEAQALLHQYNNQYDKALNIYLKYKIGKDEVFSMIQTQDLFSEVADKAIYLMDFDVEMAIKLFQANSDQLPPEKVLAQLKTRRDLLYKYLDKVAQANLNSCLNYHNELVELYAEYGQEKLLRFLEESSSYSLPLALKQCESRPNLIDETVYLHTKMGNYQEALRIITLNKDVDDAIEFCKKTNDDNLWLSLINFSLDKPDYITGLLNNIGTHVDPLILIQKIPMGMEIQGLRNSLVKILQDHKLQTNLTEGCNSILVSDGFRLFDKMVNLQRKGVYVSLDRFCLECHNPLIVDDLIKCEQITVYKCSHVFHSACVSIINFSQPLGEKSDSCPQCSSEGDKKY